MEITRNDLEQYQSILLAIDDLDEDIKNAYKPYRSPSFSSDGSSKSSTPSSPTDRALREIALLEKKRDELVQKKEACDGFVAAINDNLVFAACRDHYIKGYTWDATCVHFRRYRSKSVIIEKVNRYFDEVGL